jgi:phosphonate transport system permease protein
MTTLAPPPDTDLVLEVGRAWRKLAAQRRMYSIIGFGLLLLAFIGSIIFADGSNAGHFFDRLPHLFDFLSWLIPSDWNDVWRAMFDVASPRDTGTQEFNFTLGRIPLFGDFYFPEYLYLMLITINVALVSTIVGFAFALCFCFLVARNMTPRSSSLGFLPPSSPSGRSPPSSR